LRFLNFIHFLTLSKVCEWKVDTNPNKRLQIDKFDIDLQYVPDYSNCNIYDFLEIYDYKNESQTSLISICRNDGYEIILSKENRLFIRFVSNSNINRKGIELRIKAWGWLFITFN
jgi:hypothetical protein